MEFESRPEEYKQEKWKIIFGAFIALTLVLFSSKTTELQGFST